MVIFEQHSDHWSDYRLKEINIIYWGIILYTSRVSQDLQEKRSGVRQREKSSVD